MSFVLGYLVVSALVFVAAAVYALVTVPRTDFDELYRMMPGETKAILDVLTEHQQRLVITFAVVVSCFAVAIGWPVVPIFYLRRQRQEEAEGCGCADDECCEDCCVCEGHEEDES